jgi:hypothetical protein
MVTLLQGYVGASDAEAVELSLVDLVRSGALSEGDGRAVSKALRVAIDSRPLVGAGRVEDTLNLLGHAARSIVQLVSKLTQRPPEEICRKAGIPLLLASSIKAGLDIDWSDPKQKASAVEVVERQVSSLQKWVERHLDKDTFEPIRPYIEAITQVRSQDLESSPDGGIRIRQGVAPERRISVEDAEMRHGRKSSSKRFDGYKEHIARDLDFPAIVACAVTPANRPEEEGARPISNDIKGQRLRLVELHIDRAYVNSPVVDEVVAAGGTVFAKPWGQRSHRPGLFSKQDFKIDLRSQTITCPAGEVEPFAAGATVQFDPEACGACRLRAQCTQAASGSGRTVSIAADESRQRKFRLLQRSKSGRALLRQRTTVEHSLAHIAARKGDQARYRGTRKNLFDLRRAATIQNLEGIQRVIHQAA